MTPAELARWKHDQLKFRVGMLLSLLLALAGLLLAAVSLVLTPAK